MRNKLNRYNSILWSMVWNAEGTSKWGKATASCWSVAVQNVILSTHKGGLWIMMPLISWLHGFKGQVCDIFEMSWVVTAFSSTLDENIKLETWLTIPQWIKVQVWPSQEGCNKADFSWLGNVSVTSDLLTISVITGSRSGKESLSIHVGIYRSNRRDFKKS